MATNYTPLLGLALPVTGELAGTWGDVVSDQITTLLDSAVAGTTTLSSDADVTLTDTDGAANQSRQAILLWTANGTATRTITAPARTKAYIVINATAGTQSIKLVGAGPTTGITLVAGEKCLAAWNGSDFVKIASTVIAPSQITGATTVGTNYLTLTNPGAITFPRMNADNTVSALSAADFRTAIGASNGTVTSVAVSGGTTGLTTSGGPITSSGTITLAGTLGTANGGTGLTSFTANGVVYASSTSALTTGSALTFDGTNLLQATGGAAAVFRVGSAVSSGRASTINLGNNAGVSRATIALDAGTELMTIGSEGNFPVMFQVNGSEQMRLTSTGLGIGTSSPGYKLDVNGAVKAHTFVGLNDLTYFLNAAGNNGLIIRGNTGTPANQVELWTSGSTKLSLDASGNLGIGTSSPAGKMHLSFTTAGAAQALTLQTINVTQGNGAIRWQGSAGVNQAFIGSYFNTADTGNLEFGNGSTTNLTLSSSGNLGLGMPPSATQAAYRSMEMFGTYWMSGNGTVPATYLMTNTYYDGSFKYKTSSWPASYYSQEAGLHRWYTAPSGTAGNAISFTQAMTLDASGNVGVGTTSPSTRLHVDAPATTGNVDALTIGNNSNNENDAVSCVWLLGGSRKATIQAIQPGSSATVLTFNTQISGGSFGERARISSGGGFSVGTTADPGAGAIYATGNITAYYSDRRLKDIKGSITNALDKVAALNGVYYTNNDTAAGFGYTSQETQVGLLAQEVEAVLPEVVKAAPFDLDSDGNSKSGEHYKTVQYERIIPLLVEAIKELRAEVKALKGE